MISLIVPAYNVEEYITECLNSIRNQTYGEWEAIVVDDGSTDNTGKICDDFGNVDDRFKIYHCSNAGVSNARNVGLEYAKGDIIGFVDADDYLEKDACEIIIGYFKNNIDMLFIGHSRFFPNGVKIERIGRKIKGSDPERAVEYTLRIGEESYLGVLWNKYFSRKCIYDEQGYVRFDPTYKIGEDQIWILDVIGRVSTFDSEPRCLYNYRIRNNSVVHTRGLTPAKQSEIMAREKMVRMVTLQYPDLSTLAKIKYRNCLRKLIVYEMKQLDLKAVKSLAAYGKKYYSEYMKSESTMTDKIRETLLQLVYVLEDIC